LLPGGWTPDQAARIPDCFRQDKWDHLAMGDCQFITTTLDAQHLLNAPALPRAWFAAITAHPGDYISHRLAFTNSIMRWLGPIPVDDAFMESEINDQRYAHHSGPIFETYSTLSDALAATPFFRPYFWLAVLFLTFALSLAAAPSPLRNFAAAMSASGALYLVTYVVFGVASDFRYAYWSILAALAAGAGLLGCSWPSPRQLRIVFGAGAGAIALLVAISVWSG
jgi:hypothetical protein